MTMDSDWTNSILILAKDNLRLTQNCLESALAQSPQVPVLVVNNASQDGTGTWLRSKHSTPGIWTMSFRESRSVAECWNSGLDWISRQGGVRTLVLNNDTGIRPDTVEYLRIALEGYGPEVGMVTCVSVRERPGMEGDGPWFLSDNPDFSCFLITRETHARVRFDPGYNPAWFEDNDYHVRLHRAGIRAINTGLPFYHVGSATLTHASEGEKLRLAKGFDRSKERFRTKYGCVPGQPMYDELFDPARFGMDKCMTPKA